jgi:xylose dehydrogenase (NAD/NADP)
VRWGFIGAGFVASRALAPAVHAARLATLQVAAARDLARAEHLEPERPTDSYQDVVDAPDVDAIYISLTNEAHLPWILKALRAGKHVLCEKPLTLSHAECTTAFAVAAECSRLLVEATWTRWHPRHRRADQLLSSGLAGPVRSLQSAFSFEGVPDGNYRLDPGRGGGALLDLGPYLLWPVVDWFPPRWSSVSGSAEVNRLGADLTTTVTLADSGREASLHASITEPERQILRVTTGSHTLSWSSPAHTSWHAASSLTISEGGAQWTEQFASCDPYRLMVEDVSLAVLGDEPTFMPSAAQSLAAAELVDQIAAGVTRVAAAADLGSR